ncbi:hypothetical protein EN45_002600 [Penicillium chrysogenum]|uniref:DUF4219 domain-containing protein n=1 Tax=Penicillium chrysogenum TaxID=5076 RepID=A0A167V8H7_PENCH|nr:hypothetical protein EN45_002600 [Penicillium chrysogenum]
MSALVHDSPDRAVTAAEPLTGSDNFAIWKRLMTSYLKARQVWDVVSGDLERPVCLFKYAKPTSADIHPLVEPHLIGACMFMVENQTYNQHQHLRLSGLTKTQLFNALKEEPQLHKDQK